MSAQFAAWLFDSGLVAALVAICWLAVKDEWR